MLSYETDIPALATEWTWRNYFPRGEVIVLAGEGGIGKGQLCSLLAGHVTTGLPLPGEDTTHGPGDVIMVSPEDSLSETTVWRLRASHADMGRVFDMTELDDGSPFLANEPAHVGQLRSAIDSLPDPRLVIIDPLAGAISKSLTSVHVVRSILRPLQRMARETGVTVVLTHHLTKAGAVAGSRAVVDGVRIVLTVKRAEDNPRIRVLSVHKANVLPAGVADVRYTITGAGHDVRAEWVTRASTVQKWRRALPPDAVRRDLAAAVRDLRPVAHS